MRLSLAGIRHAEVAVRAGIARVTVTRELGGGLRLQERTRLAAESLLQERAIAILRANCHAAAAELAAGGAQ